jgi:predicted phage-related endonuclease
MRTKEQFDNDRKGSIGSSEIASIMGLSGYRTPYDVWEVKTGRKPEFQGNEATRRGQLLESAVGRWAQEQMGVSLIYPDTTYRIGHCSATPDYTYKNGIVEIKTTRMAVKDDEIPHGWFLQAQYQAAVMNALGMDIRHITVAWLGFGLEFGLASFDVDGQFSKYLLNFANDWYKKFVLRNVAPPATTSGDVEKIYPKHIDGKTVFATEETVALWERAVQLKNDLKTTEQELDGIKEQFKLMLGDAERLEYAGETLATYKASKPVKRFDAKALEKAQPDVYARYIKEGAPIRSFLLKG